MEKLAFPLRLIESIQERCCFFASRSSSLAKIKIYSIIRKQDKNAGKKWRKKKRFHEEGEKISILKLITLGVRSKLRNDVLGYVQRRQWMFRRMGRNGVILLMHERGFGWSVKIDYIDWEADEKQKDKGLSHQNQDRILTDNQKD